ncbi:p21-activated protein kinase-interacting protein 1-like [Neodiprion pinetum]|uniref:p21-activated protein kinase-interacting protein 1-like n=1 Tax=Neodiprion pinetum TaxID=441929 RepID=UPI001EDDBACD|nr:p21-activated protein kinase-interacting protein 1-like [Neodiprion pinetum]
MTTLDNIEIIIGTYEQFLLGYGVETSDDGFKLIRNFATHTHQASIRDLASSRHYLASAGADDSIYLYNMQNRMETGKLTHHNDTVNSIAFTPNASHILTCSTDGSIAAVRCGNWKLEKHWKNAHKGSSVNTICIHPSGKLALSVGSDGVLRTWNLVKGRQAYATNLIPKLGPYAKNITVTKWSPDGTKYLIATNSMLILYSVENAGIIHEAKFECRVTCVEFHDDLIIIGHDNGQVQLYNWESPPKSYLKIAHDSRVKAIACSDDIIATSSSSGELKVWRLTKNSLNLLATENCGARITCMVLARKFANQKVKQEVSIINENQTVATKKNIFKIRQEVIIEVDNDEVSNEVVDNSFKNLKRNPKSKSVTSADIRKMNSLSQNVRKKSKIIEKVSPFTERKKKNKGALNIDSKKLKLQGHQETENSVLDATNTKTMSKDWVNTEIKIKKKQEEAEKIPDLNSTINLISPSAKKRKSLTKLNPATKVIKKASKKLKKRKIMRQ